MTVRDRSGAAKDGAQSHGAAPESASAGSSSPEASSPDTGPVPSATGPAGSEPSVRDPGGPASWPEGSGEGVAEDDSADLPLWDWAPAEKRTGESRSGTDDPGTEGPDTGGFAAGGFAADAAGGFAADAAAADPPRPEWKPVVTPVEEAGQEERPPGIGERRGNLRHLSANPRMRAWQRRIIIAAIVMVAFSLWISWRLGLTLAIIVVIADTIYRSRRAYAGEPKMTGAQKRTRRQLNKLGRAGYRAMHAGLIPDSEDQIDHLVVGPAGVFAIDSEAWDKRLAVRTRNARQLWHGPYSKKDRLEHAQWEAQRAAEMLSGALGKPVSVRPVVAVYGPKVPWDVATIREVDVFSGPRLRKYLRRRARQEGVRPLADDEIERIYAAADKAFPHLSSGAGSGTSAS